MNFLSNIFDKLRANNSYDAETNEECENPPSVALNAQAEIVLFGSVDAASEISWTLRGCWDGCNGVTFATRDHVAHAFLVTFSTFISISHCSLANATNYYVSGNGNDTNNGLSTSTAFRTIQKAAELTAPGDTVFVMNGLYTNSSPTGDVVTVNHSGSP